MMGQIQPLRILREWDEMFPGQVATEADLKAAHLKVMDKEWLGMHAKWQCFHTLPAS